MNVQLMESRESRWTARAVLATVLSLILVLLLLPNGPLAGISSAQPAPTIDFLNPSGHSDEISTKNDGTGTTYHLVTWVSSVPANPVVELKYKVGTDPEVTITPNATRAADSFEFEWDAAALEDGAVTLIAILYSGSTEVARAEQVAEIVNATDTIGPQNDPSDEDQAQTVEISPYPNNGAPWGLFREIGPAAPTIGVIDVQTSTGTTAVNGYYTTSVPGTEPVWKSCDASTDDEGAEGAGDSAAAAADGVRCTAQPGDEPSEITAVAARANDASTFDDTADSGDAHRVFGYAQDPGSVSIDPPILSDAGGSDSCAPPMTAVMRDTQGNKVAGANIDVHAREPVDEIFFDDSGGNSSDHKAPDQAHTATEQGVACEDDPPVFGGEQGEHEVPGPGDTKHIESTDGTDDAGSFTFQLSNRATQTITGTTQITAWADEDGDDQQCSQEAQGDAAIGWGFQSPTATTGVPDDETTCPKPSPSPTGSPSPTPSQTPTGSPSPSPTPVDENCGEPGVECGSDGDDTITADANTTEIHCGEGDDVVDASAANQGVEIDCPDGNKTITGSPFDDDITCPGGGADLVRAGNGDDSANCGAGNDRLLGQAGDDVLISTSGVDVLVGGTGVDVLRGGGGKDRLRGGAGKDTLQGGTGGDVLAGGGGRDTLRGGPGRDKLNGGKGRDTCIDKRRGTRFRSCERRRR